MSRRRVSTDVRGPLRRWANVLLPLVLASLFVEAVTGLYVSFAPFGVLLQYALLLHIVAGLLFVLPWLIYVTDHFLLTRGQSRLNRWFGYAGAAMLTALVVTGIAEAYVAYRGPSRNDILDSTHLFATYLFLPLLVVHLALAAKKVVSGTYGEEVRNAFRAVARRLAFRSMGLALVFLLPLGVLVIRHTSPEMTMAVSDSYPLFGDGPFAPAQTMTTTGGFLRATALDDSMRSCGRSGCHEQIAREWRSSAHSWSSTDELYQHVEKLLIRDRGIEATRFCAGCHDPIPLLSGAITTPHEAGTWYRLDTPGSDEGVSCLVCHSTTRLRTTDRGIGNGNYVVAPPTRYLFAEEDGLLAEVNGLLIRAYPDAHREAFKRPLQKTAESCGTCHQQYIEPPLRSAYLPLQRQYGSWRESPYGGADPTRKITCQGCHMPLVDSTDPARGEPTALDPTRSEDDGKHRSHRFIAANSIPWAHGDREQIRLTERFLRGEQEIPEIADRWRTGPVVPLRILATSTAEPGGALRFRIRATNNKAGHAFPAGALDLVQAWVEVVVTDATGRILFHDGALDERNYLKGRPFAFGERLEDVEGRPLWEHELWNIARVVEHRVIEPEETEEEAYAVPIPDDAVGPLRIEARLLYRKFHQRLSDAVNDYDGTTAPVVELSSDEAIVELVRVPDAPNR